MKNPWKHEKPLDLSEADVDYFTVKITGSSKKTYWYADKVGRTYQVFDLIDPDGDDDKRSKYPFKVLNEHEEYDGRLIDKADCVVL